MNHIKNITLISALFCSQIVGASRKASRHQEATPSWSMSFEEPKQTHHPEYHILQGSGALHREALSAFQNEEYQHSRSCFSLALKASPNSTDILLNYALFSMIAPWSEGQSLNRAAGLLKQVKQKDNPRLSLAQGTLLWLQGKHEEAIAHLNLVEHPYFDRPAIELLNHIKKGSTLTYPSWSKSLLRARLDPREKRESR